MSFDEWVQVGIEAGWVVEFCAMHDAGLVTKDERERFAEGGDPCLPSLRVVGES